MKKGIIITFVILLNISGLCAEDNSQRLFTSGLAIKTNALYWATTTPNLGLEIGLAPQYTLDLSANYNFWTFSHNKKFKHWLIQPEVRYWLDNRFEGHFLGIHGLYAEYNVGGIKAIGMEDHRYQGNMYGGGVSYGYNWVLSERWNLEATLGIGFLHLDYSKYPCYECGEKIKDSVRNYFGPTKVGLSFIYILK